MRKIISFMHISLDGFVAPQKGVAYTLRHHPKPMRKQPCQDDSLKTVSGFGCRTNPAGHGSRFGFPAI